MAGKSLSAPTPKELKGGKDIKKPTSERTDAEKAPTAHNSRWKR